MREVARSTLGRAIGERRGAHQILRARRLLRPARAIAAEVDVWRTAYQHPMDSPARSSNGCAAPAEALHRSAATPNRSAYLAEYERRIARPIRRARTAACCSRSPACSSSRTPN
jgi:trans-aconitate methyltransferase